MAIATLHKTFSRTLLLLGVVSLVACGGGGGGGTKTNPSSKAETSVSNSVASSVEMSSSSSSDSSGVSNSLTSSLGMSSGNSSNSLASSVGVSSSKPSNTSSVSNSHASSDGVIVSSSSSQSSAADTTPAAFSFTPTTDAALSSEITSNTVTVSGIDAAVPVSITNGKYSIDGGAFTSAAGTVSPMQTISVKVMSSNANSTAIAATLTVGGVSATYTVTTLADAIPGVFSFNDEVDADIGVAYTSNTITVGGIDTAAAISITGGEYSINGGAFTSSAGTVTNGQTVTVKAVAPELTETTQEVVVTIGGVSGTYAVTTVPDTFPPVAEFKFPTPYTLSEAISVKVRGTATDDHAIASVKVVVTNDLDATVEEKEVTPKAEGDYSSWTVEVPLTANAENEIKVIAEDDRGNAIAADTANKVVVRQRVDYSAVFPDTGSVVSDTFGLVLDRQRNRLLYATGENRHKISEIDISTGNTKIFADFTERQLGAFGMGVIDQSSEYVYFPLIGAKTIYKVKLDNPNDYSVHENEAYGSTHRAVTLNNTGDIPRLISARTGEAPYSGGIVSTWLDSWTASVFSDAALGVPDSTIPFGNTSALVFDQKNNRYLVSDTTNDAVIAIDALNGIRSIFSSEVVGSGDAYGMGDTGLIKTIALDEPRNRLIVLEMITGNIFAVNLDTAQRSIISQMTLLHPTSNIWPDNEKNYIGAQIDVENELLYTVHHRVQALMVVDLQSGQQLILSKAAHN